MKPGTNEYKPSRTIAAIFIVPLLSLCLLFSMQASAVVTVTDASDEGQACYRIQTDNATYFFQKAAGGFSSIVDNNGNDWVSHSSSSGASGMYRGIPNLVYPGDLFHPGFTHCNSNLESSSSDKATIVSQTNDNNWAVKWEFYSTYATLTVTKTAGQYWFLYEGTPGGSYSNSDDYWTTSNGSSGGCGSTKDGDIASPEWIYFGDHNLNRVLFLVHHEDDNHSDKYYPMPPMTVFGFGRDGLNKYLTGQNTFSIGFAETTDHNEITTIINSILSGKPPVWERTDVEKKIEESKKGTSSVSDVQAAIDGYLNEYDKP